MWPIRMKAPGESTPESVRPLVLVVDDEQPIRDLQSRMLTQSGFDTILVDDAEKALAIIRDGKPIDLVIADVHMPTMNGDEMARRIRAMRPDLKILFVTGYADTLFTSQPVLWENEAYLDKPFTRRGLLEAVSLLLDGNMRRAV
jgi:two-component system, cell cycle sensor histidine kinase and response regulator CckA